MATTTFCKLKQIRVATKKKRRFGKRISGTQTLPHNPQINKAPPHSSIPNIKYPHGPYRDRPRVNDGRFSRFMSNSDVVVDVTIIIFGGGVSTEVFSSEGKIFRISLAM